MITLPLTHKEAAELRAFIDNHLHATPAWRDTLEPIVTRLGKLLDAHDEAVGDAKRRRAKVFDRHFHPDQE
jgi:hypothetical protein